MKTVEIFALEEKLATSGCGCGTTSSVSPDSSACCGSDEGTESGDITITSLVEKFKAGNPELADFKLSYLKDSDSTDYLEIVNQILVNNGERLVVNQMNMDFVFPKILPMVIVNGKIVAINNLPMDKELQTAIETEVRIVTKGGCC